MDQLSDAALGAIVLAVFIPAVVVIGYLITRFQHARHARAWGRLLRSVEGTVEPVSGGGAESRMRGRYQGHAIIASMVPQAATASDRRYNHFSVTMLGVPGARDWRVTRQAPLWPLDSPAAPRIETTDEELRVRLDAAGLLDAFARCNLAPADAAPPLIYSASESSLTVQGDVGPEWLPSEAAFLAMLDALIDVAGVNARVNSASS